MPRKKSGKSAKELKREENEEKSKRLSQGEFEKKVLELAESGLTSEKIGEKLRQENIHPGEHNKKISRILKEKEKYNNPDLKNIEEKLGKIRAHFDANKQDKRAMRERERIAAKLRVA